MPTLLVCFDGFELRIAQQQVRRLQFLAKLLDTGSLHRFREISSRISCVNWVTAFTGKICLDHGMTGDHELDGSGHLRRFDPARRTAKTVYEAADIQRRSVLSVNLPFQLPAQCESTVCITDEFFTPDAATLAHRSVCPQSLVADLAPLAIRENQITPEHLASLCPGLLKLPSGDKRRSIAAMLLARALSIHQIATALASDSFDLVCIRYDTIKAFYAAFIDHFPVPAEYIPKQDAEALADLLPSVLELHDHFLARLVELIQPEAIVVASDHGFADEPIRLRLSAGKNADAAEKAAASPRMTPACAMEYFDPEAWALIRGTDRTSVQSPRTLAELAQTLSEGLSLDPWQQTPAPSDSLEQITRGELQLDDQLELGLESLPDLVDAARETHIQDSLRLAAMQAAAERRHEIAADLLRTLLQRSFNHIDALQLVRVLLNTGQFAQAMPAAKLVSDLSPVSIEPHIGLLAAAEGCGHPEMSRLAVERMIAVDCTDPRTLAAANNYQVPVPPEPIPPPEVDVRSETIPLYHTKPVHIWDDFAQELDPELARFDEVNSQIIQLVKRASLIHSPARETASPTDGYSRARAGGLSSISRHCNPDEAAGLARLRERALNGSADSPINVDLLLDLHRELFASNPATAGVIRDHPMFINGGWLGGAPARVQLAIPQQPREALQRIFDHVQQMRQRTHPLLITTGMLLDFWFIHPFADGNGRTGRTLQHQILHRAGYESLRWMNIERRLDRCRDLFGAALTSEHHRHDGAFIRFWVKFHADSLGDTLARMRRVIAVGA